MLSVTNETYSTNLFQVCAIYDQNHLIRLTRHLFLNFFYSTPLGKIVGLPCYKIKKRKWPVFVILLIKIITLKNSKAHFLYFYNRLQSLKKP